MAEQAKEKKGGKPPYRVSAVYPNGEKAIWVPCGVGYPHDSGNGCKLILDFGPLGRRTVHVYKNEEVEPPSDESL